MPPSEQSSLWRRLAAGRSGEQIFSGPTASVPLINLIRGSILNCRVDELGGRSVVLALRDQLAAALALIELDGIVRRIVLCPPDLPGEQIQTISKTVAADAVIRDRDIETYRLASVEDVVEGSPNIAVKERQQFDHHQTEWVLLTSGTTGLPKLVVHTLSSLTTPIRKISGAALPVVWSTFYDIRRYGGLQIFLRAVLGGGSLILSDANEATGDFLLRAGRHGVTHISGTPSHWRRALMSPQAHAISPRYIRLSGEIADQSILDHLRSTYPSAGIGHAFASTEAGVAFEVDDGLAGFPAGLISAAPAGVELKVIDGSLRLRSARVARRYIGTTAKPLTDCEGFVDTGDVVELRGDRFYFIGRRDGVINVGGKKVHPEEVEAVINRHPNVEMSAVNGRKSPITGAVVVADVVLRQAVPDDARDIRVLQREIIESCQAVLAPYKVPATVRFVPSLAVTGSGKLARGAG